MEFLNPAIFLRYITVVLRQEMNINVTTISNSRTSYAVGHRVAFDGQGGMRGVYLLVKTSIYCLTMPNNKQSEGVSDLVTRMQVIAFKLEIPSRQTELYKLS